MEFSHSTCHQFTYFDESSLEAAATNFLEELILNYRKPFHPPSQGRNHELVSVLPHRDPTMICGLLLLLASIAHHATSMAVDVNPTMAMTPLNRIVYHCFTPDTSPNIGEANSKDCRDTLLLLARSPDFTTPMRFSKNPRSGVKVPRGWRSGDCLIFVSCENDRDSYTFRFADVLVVAKRIVDNCVGTTVTEKWGILRWGGVDILGDSETFYVSVGKPFAPRTVGEGVVLVNGTMLDPAIDVF